MKLLSLVNEKDDIHCAYNVLQNIGYEPVSHERHWISTFAKFNVYMPQNSAEQKCIGDYFANLDNLITLHQRKFEKLTNVKKSMLEKMFPQNGSSYPEIRFKGFTDPWEQRKFGEIASKYEDPVPTPHDGYYRLGIRSHAKGTFHSYVAKGQELETAQMHRVAAGNFIVNITFGWEHAVAITDENDAGKLVSHRFPQFSFAEGMVPEFFRYVIVDEKFRHHLWLASPGGAGRNRVLKLDDMLNYLMRFPSRDEQIKIAEFFRQLDHLITLHQRELEKLQNIKKSMLEKMFV
jgi:type I restriction enzyme S subunit